MKTLAWLLALASAALAWPPYSAPGLAKRAILIDHTEPQDHRPATHMPYDYHGAEKFNWLPPNLHADAQKAIEDIRPEMHEMQKHREKNWDEMWDSRLGSRANQHAQRRYDWATARQDDVSRAVSKKAADIHFSRFPRPPRGQPYVNERIEGGARLNRRLPASLHSDARHILHDREAQMRRLHVERTSLADMLSHKHLLPPETAARAEQRLLATTMEQHRMGHFAEKEVLDAHRAARPQGELHGLGSISLRPQHGGRLDSGTGDRFTHKPQGVNIGASTGGQQMHAGAAPITTGLYPAGGVSSTPMLGPAPVQHGPSAQHMFGLPGQPPVQSPKREEFSQHRFGMSGQLPVQKAQNPHAMFGLPGQPPAQPDRPGQSMFGLPGQLPAPPKKKAGFRPLGLPGHEQEADVPMAPSLRPHPGPVKTEETAVSPQQGAGISGRLRRQQTPPQRTEGTVVSPQSAEGVSGRLQRQPTPPRPGSVPSSHAGSATQSQLEQLNGIEIPQGHQLHQLQSIRVPHERAESEHEHGDRAQAELV